MDGLQTSFVLCLAVAVCLIAANEQGGPAPSCANLSCLDSMNCAYGNVKRRGCPICRCKRPPKARRPSSKCASLECLERMFCAYGNVKRRGCPICRCKGPPKTTTSGPSLCLTCCGPPPCCNFCN